MRLLYISKEIQKIYRETTNENKNLTEFEIRKKLTRNFILGTMSTKYSKENIQTRYYGKLKLVVDIERFRLLYISNNKNIRKKDTYFINKVEKEHLNKLFNIKE